MKTVFNLTKIDNEVKYAFQSICCIKTGKEYGYEALLRNVEPLGFESIDAFFDAAVENNKLVETELLLRKKAIAEFKSHRLDSHIKLFLNIDNRIFAMSDYKSGETMKYLLKHDLPLDTIVFELSEKHHISNTQEVIDHMRNYESQGYTIAIDDFGTGHSGLKFLYEARPNIIKLDRFFIIDIDTDRAKQSIAKHQINLAKELGIVTLAEGVETKAELDMCRALGFDLVQGFYIHRPSEVL